LNGCVSYSPEFARFDFPAQFGVFAGPAGLEYATELDNCDIVGGYEYYTATGFLNALERDIIDKDL
jgi:hypothetical protein